MEEYDERKEYFKNKIFPIEFETSPRLNGILYDSETDTIKIDEETNELILRLGYTMKIRDDKKIDEFLFFDKDVFTNYILDCVGFHGWKTLYVWAHNSGFDFRTSVNVKSIKNAGFSLKTFTTNPFILEYADKRDNAIVFLDTFNFFKTSIENLGKYFGVEKIQIDFKDYQRRKERVPEPLLIKRCINDVETMYRLLIQLYAQMPNKVKYSAAQESFTIWRTTLTYPIEKINTELANFAYHGGRVEVFRNDYGRRKKYDVNSMYPYVMWKYPYPIALEKLFLEPSRKLVEYYIENGFGFIADATFNIPTSEHIGAIPYYRLEDKKLIFPVGRFRSVVCSPEIMLNLDWVEKFHRVEFYHMGKIFEPFVNKYYALKQSSTGFLRDFYKIGILNSCYGKTAQKAIQTLRLPMYDGMMEFGQASLTDLEGITRHMKFLEEECFTTITGDRRYSVVIAAFVCSNSRAELYNRIIPYDEDIYYVDTDCYVLPDTYDLPVNEELGGIKLEDYGFAQFFTPKIYFFEHYDEEAKETKRKMKLKGVKKDWKIEFIGNTIKGKGTRIMNFSETLNKGKFGVYEIEDEKKVELIDTKRIWDGGNISRPIVLME